jgi:hypothetical protein
MLHTLAMAAALSVFPLRLSFSLAPSFPLDTARREGALGHLLEDKRSRKFGVPATAVRADIAWGLQVGGARQRLGNWSWDSGFAGFGRTVRVALN